MNRKISSKDSGFPNTIDQEFESRKAKSKRINTDTDQILGLSDRNSKPTTQKCSYWKDYGNNRGYTGYLNNRNRRYLKRKQTEHFSHKQTNEINFKMNWTGSTGQSRIVLLNLRTNKQNFPNRAAKRNGWGLSSRGSNTKNRDWHHQNSKKGGGRSELKDKPRTQCWNISCVVKGIQKPKSWRNIKEDKSK